MRTHPTARDRQAAALFAALGVFALAGSFATGRFVLVAVAAVTVVAALASLKGYPIDRDW